MLSAASAYQHGFLVAIIQNCCADYKEVHLAIIKRFSGWLVDPVYLGDMPSKHKTWCQKIESTKNKVCLLRASKL